MNAAPARRRIAILSGAGISAESGLRTFRAADGLWEDHRVEDVASPEGFARDPELVLRFYDLRRAQVIAAAPNAGHRAIAALEARFNVDVVTQNIDDLHERAGSSRVLHLHGEVRKARPVDDPDATIPWDGPLGQGDTDARGVPLRPHVVWFGEAVPLLDEAARRVAAADAVIVVGTSLRVYPAASLLNVARDDAHVFVVDPELPKGLSAPADRFHPVPMPASEGLPAVRAKLEGMF